ncbi:PREDICTED: uncharacterized protein LOC109218291 [Nicotiana attenuata]|uniref:uncharacterized protein LOC109218291 n=1 Tax=Nicotiana attenuata TaxID=49451 RepID=UPI0009050487|nr:PREDICTED: uncharacterized protein LOC109218291 [Nicotiana attenuata]
MEESGDSSAPDHIRRAQLKMQFQGMSKGDHETIDAYVKKLKSIAVSLAEIGSPIPDPDMVLQLLAGLPSEYLPVQKIISSRVPLPTFEEACSLVYMQEAILLQDQDPPPPLSTMEKIEATVNAAGSVSTAVGIASVALSVVGRVAAVGTVSAAVTAVGTVATVVGAVGVTASAGWKIWTALERK